MARLVFHEAKHLYELDGVKVPGVTDIVALLGGYEGITPAVLQAAARRGTAVHEYCELIDMGAPPELVEADLHGYITAYKTFLRDYNPEWLHIETPVFSAVHGYAGRLDRVGYIDRKVTVVDIKTTSSIDRTAKIKMACQLAGYAGAYEEQRAVKVENHIGVQLKKDGKYTVHSNKRSEAAYGFSAPELFQNLLNITKLIGGYKWQQT